MANGVMECIFWDVEHGSATYISTPDGKHMVVDLGVGSYRTGDNVFSPLLHLKMLGVQTLDAVFLTHPHRDHLDDIHNFDQLSPRVLFRPRHLSESDIRTANRAQDRSIIDKYLEIDRRYSCPVSLSDDPCRSDNTGGVAVSTFAPCKCAASNLNNHSLVNVFAYAGMKLLVPGDNEAASWDELLELPSFNEAIKGTDVFVAPHHGRNSGFSSRLFEFITPRLTIISDGRFCDTSATARYSAKTRGWTVYRRNGEQQERKCVTTRNDGVIVVKFGVNANGSKWINVQID
jgi:beta-lactamase superfamily II metal-dependent hydrolase